jgi:four helix bundle protein
MRDFKTLVVWQKAHQLTLAIYEATTNFPKDELFGLTSQMRRAASSIPTNIAEGCGRSSDVELARFLDIAGGSASELEYQLILSRDLQWLDTESYKRLDDKLDEVKRMIYAFIKNLRSRQ